MERSALEMTAIICVRQPTVAFGSVAPPRLDGAGIRSVIDEHADAASFQRRFRLADALQRRRGCCPILTGKT